MSNRKKIGISLICVGSVLILLSCILLFNHNNKKDVKTNNNDNQKYLSYKMNGNGLENFDLYFLQLENEKKNKIYSPLSIKYALEMLAEGANGETKEQITSILGSYSAKKYPNNKNMTFANALFIRDSYKNSIKNDYIKNLEQKFNASVVYDSFNTPKVVNSFVKKNTFNLIDNLVDDVSDTNFLLINALAIDMEWVKKIKPTDEFYTVSYDHEEYSSWVGALDWDGYYQYEFEGMDKNVAATDFDVTVNKYDIIKDLGEDTIRQTLTDEYNKWLKASDSYFCEGDGTNQEPVEDVVDRFVNDLKKNYKRYDNSTDFNYYVDDDIKVFAKDLKKYDGTTLQYVGIMPLKEDLDNYVKNTSADKLNNIISNLKDINYDSFKEGVITNIHGAVPIFKFSYELKLKEDLNELGVSNVFDMAKSDLSNLTSEKAFIGSAKHKANIEFSNNGIKAAAATSMGGLGAGDCGFEYFFKVPVEQIDLTFNRPYMFMIRDKDSGEVWFMGTVYNPTDAYSIDN